MRALTLPLALLALVLVVPVSAQPGPPPGEAGTLQTPLRLSGPRVGLTWLSDETIEEINDVFGESECVYNPNTGGDCVREDVITADFPVVTQFGWQWERKLFQSRTGLTGLTELVVLLGGAERGIFLPSGTFLVGVRTPSGVEFGLGPNISASSVGYAFTVGVAQDFGDFAVPINLAVVTGRQGPRVSLLIGMVVSERRY